MLMILVICSLASTIQAQALPTKNKAHTASMPPLFFDADLTHFDRYGIQQNFEGNVVLMIGGNLICADTLSLDRDKDLFTAKGHVLVVSAQQVFGGDEVTYHFQSEDFFITHAFIVTQDQKKADAISHKILGVTPLEVEFELEKSRQLQLVSEKKEKLKRRFREIDFSQKPMMIEEYAVLLEKEQMISQQKNPVLAQIGEQKRESIARRREFWEESRKTRLPVSQPLLAASYVRLDGEWIERTEGNHYRASKINLTPCLCDEDEKPAWQIHADTIDAYSEGYADLDDAVIEVKGVPIIYLPYLRLPMKGQRQSGFLFPTTSYNRFNGSVFSQSTFFDLGPNKDSTMTVDFIEKRGTRFGGEFRYQQKTYSGWELQGELIRDRQWLGLQDERAEINRAYQDGLEQAIAVSKNQALPPARQTSYTAPALSTPQYWNNLGFSYCFENPDLDICRDMLSNYIKAPDNTFRYKMEWKGMTFLTPRLSFVSDGRYLSDHRYLQDLYFDKFNESFNPSTPDLFAKAKGQMHLDGDDFYAGIGSVWGDQLRDDTPFSGHQVPASLRLRSRTFKLLNRPKPVFGSLLLNYKKIDYFEDASFDEYFPNNTLNVRLDSGNWSQAKFNILAPLFSDEVFVLNYFTELEARAIETGYRLTQTAIPVVQIDQNLQRFSSIRTLRLGLDFQLPIDGTMQLSPAGTSKADGINFLNHRMNWGLTYSLRPSVVRKGPYGQVFNLYKYNPGAAIFQPNLGDNAQRLTYFASESPENFDSDFLPESERMIPHNQVLFSTSHDWVTYKKTWQNTRTLTLDQQATQKPISFSALARNELEYAQYLSNTLDSVLSDGDAEKRGFHIFESESKTIVHADGSISYDFKKEEDRRAANQDPTAINSLLNPWSPARANASVNAYDWTLSNFTKYDLYAKLVSELRFQLSPPTLLKTRFSFGYSIEKEINYDLLGGLTLNKTLTRSYGVSSSLIPYISLLGEYDIRTKYNQDPSQMYYASAGGTYASPSNCWGLQFFWRKDYPDADWHGTYYLSLTVKFFNYNREYGNLLAKVNPD